MFKKGFTLIELLIVIAIIGILSVALVPTGMNALKKARDGTRVANLGTIKTAMMQYVLDNSICPSEATGASTDALIAAELNTYFDANTPKDPSGNKHYHYFKTGKYCVVVASLEFTEGQLGNYEPVTAGMCSVLDNTEVTAAKINALKPTVDADCYIQFVQSNK